MGNFKAPCGGILLDEDSFELDGKVIKTKGGSSGGGGMIVRYTQSSGVWQSDKTLDEILEALSNGINVFAITPNAIKLDVEYVDFNYKEVTFSKVVFSLSGGIEDYEVTGFDAIMIEHTQHGVTYSNGTWTAPA